MELIRNFGTKYIVSKSIILLLAVLFMPFYLKAQILTEPLFKRIIGPKLESSSGNLINIEQHEYFIAADGKDSVDISFTIVVPREMLSEQWAISLTPTIQSTREDGRLKDVVIKGWKFAEAQDEDYDKYDSFVGSIIDTSLYEKMYVDQKKLEKEIEKRHDEYWKFYYDEWERQVDFEIWKSRQDGSSKMFSRADRNDYRQQLYNQYLIRIRNQSDRYLKANMDTTGLHEKYMREFEQHDARMPRFFVDNSQTFKNVPKRYKDIYDSGRTLDDITENMLDLLVKRDSALMSLLPTLDYKKIVENEKRTMLQNGIYDDLIQLPKNMNALLDTIVYDMRSDYRYLYTYSYPVLENVNDTIKVKLSSKILATDRSGYSSTAEEDLTFIVANNTLSEGLRVESYENEYVDDSEFLIKKEVDIELDTIEKVEESIYTDQDSLERLSEKLRQLTNSKEIKVVTPLKEEDVPVKKDRAGFGSRIQVIE